MSLNRFHAVPPQAKQQNQPEHNPVSPQPSQASPEEPRHNIAPSQRRAAAHQMQARSNSWLKSLVGLWDGAANGTHSRNLGLVLFFPFYQLDVRANIYIDGFYLGSK